MSATFRSLCSWQRWITGWSNTAANRRAVPSAVDADQDRSGRVQAPAPQVGQESGHHGGVLGAALDQAERMFGPVDADPQRHHAQVLTEVDTVDHQRHQVQVTQRCGQQLGQGGLGIATNRRETADLLVAEAARSTCSPTGSRPTG